MVSVLVVKIHGVDFTAKEVCEETHTAVEAVRRSSATQRI